MHNEIYKSFYTELQKEAGIGTFAKRVAGRAGLKLFDMGARRFFRKQMGIKPPQRTRFVGKSIINKSLLYGGGAAAMPIAAHTFNPRISNMRGY
jgi:hypothetical protein